MTNITYRAIKGAPLTSDEIDANFNNLNIYKLELTQDGDFGIGMIIPVHYDGYTTFSIGGINDGCLDLLFSNGSLGIESYVTKGISTATDTSIIKGYSSDGISSWELGLYDNTVIFGSDGALPVSIYTNNIEAMHINIAGFVGIGTSTPTSKLHVVGLPVYANNAAAITGGLTAGAFYRTGSNPDSVCVVH